uniref:F-box/WD repeat-containing protein 10-like n=1 Tax=Saccoglossus kowalevskii TaxID=10224 RepID=A0ABM0MP96_SACKO|nr:PREDICTED: F-box/WD repeat-containing protein 10-like [Saccoglossus kowalevskii]
MKHPSENSENFEFNLGKALQLRCVYSGMATTCGECESCKLGAKLATTREWFLRAGEYTKRRFVLGLVRRFRSVDLIRYIIGLLKPLLCKDFTYARSRTNPASKGDQADMCGDRALNPSTVDKEISETWHWFLNSKYWTKANFLLGVMQMAEPELLYVMGTQARTMLISEEKSFHTAPEDELCNADTQSLDASVYSFDSEEHPEIDLLKLACSEYSVPVTNPFAEEFPEDSDHEIVEDDGESSILDSQSEFSSIDPTCLVIPTTTRAILGVMKYKDFIRHLPVHLSKYILSFLDQPNLYNCLCVSKHWRVIVEEVHRDRDLNQAIWEEVMLMQGASAQGCNPVYAKKIQVAVPRLMSNESFDIAPNLEEERQDVHFKSEITLQQSYSGILTEEITVEERNVYCGSYNVMVLSDQDDYGRVVHYNYGQLVAMGSADRKVHLIDVISGKEVGPVITGHAGSVRCVYIDEERNFVLSGSYDTSIRCWNLDTGQCQKIFRGHRNTVMCLDMDDDRVVSGGKDNAVKVWNFVSGKCQRTFKHRHQVLAVAILNGRVVSGCEGGRVKVWDIPSASLLKRLDGHHGPVTGVKIDEWHIITASKDCYALTWSNVGVHKRCLSALRHPKEVLCIEMSYMRLVSGCADGKLRIWNFLKGECLRVMRGNSRSDPVDTILCCGDRMLLNTVNTLLVFNFERVDWDYTLDSDKIEILTYNNHYADAPLRKHNYSYVRANRMERAGSANPKIIQHNRCEQAPSAMVYLKYTQIPHSTRTLSAKSMKRAALVQSTMREVQLTNSLKGSVYHNVQGIRPQSAETTRMSISSRPTTSMSKSVKMYSRPGTCDTHVTTLSMHPPSCSAKSRPDSVLSSCSRPVTAYSTQSAKMVSQTKRVTLPERGHSAPASVQGRFYASRTDPDPDEVVSVSEARAVWRSHQRVKDRLTPSDRLLLVHNAVEISKDTTGELVKNTTHNCQEIEYKMEPSPERKTVSREDRSVSIQASRSSTSSSVSSYRSCVSRKVTTSETVVTPIESMPLDAKPHLSMFSKTVNSTIPKPTLLRPQTAKSRVVKQSTVTNSGEQVTATVNESPSMRRSKSVGALPSTPAAFGVSMQFKKKKNGMSTTHTEPVIMVPMFMHGPSKIEVGTPKSVQHEQRPPSRPMTASSRFSLASVKDPLKVGGTSEFQLRTRTQTEDYLEKITTLQEQYMRERSLGQRKKQRAAWLSKAKGLTHEDFSKRPKPIAPEIGEF